MSKLDKKRFQDESKIYNSVVKHQLDLWLSKRNNLKDTYELLKHHELEELRNDETLSLQGKEILNYVVYFGLDKNKITEINNKKTASSSKSNTTNKTTKSTSQTQNQDRVEGEEAYSYKKILRKGEQFGRVNCDYCDNSFVDKWHYKIHLARKHKDVEEVVDYLKGYDKKYRQKHGKAWILYCNVDASCDYWCLARDDLKQHFKGHGAENWPKCPNCDKSFKYESYLRKHILENHATAEEQAENEQKRTCEFCAKKGIKKVFTRVTNCNTHKRKVHFEEMERSLI